MRGEGQEGGREDQFLPATWLEVASPISMRISVGHGGRGGCQ